MLSTGRRTNPPVPGLCPGLLRINCFDGVGEVVAVRHNTGCGGSVVSCRLTDLNRSQGLAQDAEEMHVGMHLYFRRASTFDWSLTRLRPSLICRSTIMLATCITCTWHMWSNCKKCARLGNNERFIIHGNARRPFVCLQLCMALEQTTRDR